MSTFPGRKTNFKNSKFRFGVIWDNLSVPQIANRCELIVCHMFSVVSAGSRPEQDHKSSLGSIGRPTLPPPHLPQQRLLFLRRDKLGQERMSGWEDDGKDG